MKNELILCDCFGVVMEEMAPKWLSNYFSDEEVALVKPKYFDPVDLGEITIWDAIKKMAKDLNLPEERVKREWNSYKGVKTDTVEALRKLKNKYHIVLLSNASKNLVEGYFEEYNIGDCFEKIFISADYGIKKPAPEFYKLAINSYDTIFDKIYMIDDNAENLHINGVELTGIHFKTADDIRKAFNI